MWTRTIQFCFLGGVVLVFFNRNVSNYQMKWFIPQRKKMQVGGRLSQLIMIFRYLTFLLLPIVCHRSCLPNLGTSHKRIYYQELFFSLLPTKISTFHQEHFPVLTGAACRRERKIITFKNWTHTPPPNIVLRTWSNFQRILIFLFKSIQTTRGLIFYTLFLGAVNVQVLFCSFHKCA